MNKIKKLADYVGNTPLVCLNHLPNNRNKIFAKLEGNNPAGSVKDRPALNMIRQAQMRGDIKKGDKLIEATSGNTGIALAMAAAIEGYHMTLIMPKNSTQERKDAMRAYGATLIEAENMEVARDLALKMQQNGEGLVLDQFNNPDNKNAHYHSTAPEIWQQTQGKITHFVSSMGTTGTITGVAKFLKEKNPDIQIIGLQPSDGSNIAGIRRWSKAYLPKFLSLSWWTPLWMFTKQMLRTILANSPKKREFFVGCHQVAQHGRLTKSLKPLLMPISYLLFVIEAIGIYQRDCLVYNHHD